MRVTLIRRRRPPCAVHVVRDGYYDGADAPYRCLLCGAVATEADDAAPNVRAVRPTLVVLPGGRAAPAPAAAVERRRHG